MSIGFTQKHVEEFQVDNLTPEQFLSISIEASKLVGWVISHINETGFTAYTNNGVFSWNAEIRLKINSGSATILSQSTGNEIIEFGKNKANIESFMLIFYELKKSLTVEELTVKYKDLQSTFV